MNHTPYVLSIWEIAFRWHNENPELPEGKLIPVPVQDTLRMLSGWVVRGELRVCSTIGVVHWAPRDAPTYDEWRPTIANLSDEEKFEEWYSYRERRLDEWTKIAESLTPCYERRLLDKTILDSAFTTFNEFMKACQYHCEEVPTFWKVEGERQVEAEADETRLRPNQVDRIRCQAIAATLWLSNDQMTIAEITKHSAIQIYGNGKHYKDATLRGWIKEVDPRPAEKKRGRPRKVSS